MFSLLFKLINSNYFPLDFCLLKKKIKEFVNSNTDMGSFEIMLKKKSTPVKRYQHIYDSSNNGC